MCTANAALGAQAFGGAAQTVGSYYAASAQRANDAAGGCELDAVDGVASENFDLRVRRRGGGE